MTTAYTLKQLEGSVACECGCKHWGRSNQSRARIICADCSRRAPDKPQITKTQVRIDLAYAKRLMSIIGRELTKSGPNDDPRLGADIDLKELSILSNELIGAVSAFASYVSERGGQL